jgi:hypothetical protein
MTTMPNDKIFLFMEEYGQPGSVAQETSPRPSPQVEREVLRTFDCDSGQASKLNC